MTQNSSRPASLVPSRHTSYAVTRLAAPIAVITAVGLAIGCSAGPTSREAGSPRTSPMPEAMSEDLTFADGASLTKNLEIGWGDGLMADDGWASVPSDQPGRWSYINSSGTCTAAFRGGVLGDASGMDDREATDALIADQSGDDFLGAEWLTDGQFLLHAKDGVGVEHRQFSYTFNESGYFMAARAFVEVDYSVWVIVMCEGEPVGPVAQEVLSKNVVAVSVPRD